MINLSLHLGNLLILQVVGDLFPLVTLVICHRLIMLVIFFVVVWTSIGCPLLIQIIVFPFYFLHVSITTLFIVVISYNSVNLMMFLTIVPLATRLWLIGVVLVRIGMIIVVLRVASTSII